MAEILELKKARAARSRLEDLQTGRNEHRQNRRGRIEHGSVARRRPGDEPACVEALRGNPAPERPDPFAGLTRGYYRVIAADPPWHYATFSDKGKRRSADRHYRTLTIPALFRSACRRARGTRRASDA